MSRMTFLIVAALAAAVPASAGAATATTFCVPVTSASCTGTAEPTLQDALTAASNNNSPSATKDTIRVAAGTYQGPFNDAAGNPVRILGAGAAKTILENTATADPTLNLFEPASELQSVKVVATAGSNTSAVATNGTLIHVVVTEPPGNSGTTGLTGGGTFDQGTILLTDPTSVASTASSATLTRSRITAGAAGISSSYLAAAYDDLIRVTQPGAVALDVSPYVASSASLLAREDTLIGPGAAGSTGVRVAGSTGIVGHGADASADLGGLIIRGFGTDLAATGFSSSGCPPTYTTPCSGKGSISVAYSDFATSRKMSDANGSITQGAGNVDNVDPGFRNAGAGNFDLSFTSPLIDRGDPAEPGSGEPTLDLAGRPRKVDGDRNGSAIADMGAFETPPPRAPTASFRMPRYALVGKRVRFDGSASRDPQAAALHFAWRFGDGNEGSGTKPSHVYHSAKGFRVTLVVRDAFGLSSAPRSRRLPVFKRTPCVVPKLRGATVANARTALRHGHCDVGLIRHEHSNSVAKGRVLSSTPGPGRIVKRGFKVALVVSRG